MSTPALRLWTGHTVHKRFVPFERAFRYQLLLIDIDIDRMAEAAKLTPLFRIGRAGLYSFQARDHGGGGLTGSLREWAEDMFARAGVDLSKGAIRLVTFPRHLFYKFAPLSLWYGYDPHGTLRGVIYEVNNTFGEHHAYVAAIDQDRSVHGADKSFYVSPFFDVSGRYRFTLRAPASTLDVVVENIDGGKRTHLANIKARPLAATSANLMRFALRNPLSTIGVTFGIHWQAFRLWLRGAKYRSRPAAPARPATVAVPEYPHSVSAHKGQA